MYIRAKKYLKGTNTIMIIIINCKRILAPFDQAISELANSSIDMAEIRHSRQIPAGSIFAEESRAAIK